MENINTTRNEETTMASEKITWQRCNFINGQYWATPGVRSCDGRYWPTGCGWMIEERDALRQENEWGLFEVFVVIDGDGRQEIKTDLAGRYFSLQDAKKDAERLASLE